MLKMSRSFDLAQRNNNNEIVGGGSDDKNLSKFKKSKNAKSRIQIYIRATREPTFLTSGAKEAFNQSRQELNKALIL